MRPWRGYRRPFQSILIPCLLVFLAFVVSAASADIFLAANVSGRDVWDGNCSTTACTDSSSCEPETDVLTPIYSTGGETCLITFKAGTYSNSPIIWDLSIGATIRLGDGVSDLNLSLTSRVEGPSEILFVGPKPKLTSSLIHIEDTASSNELHVTFQNIDLHDTQVTLNSVNLTHFYISNISWSGPDTSPIQIPEADDGTSVQFSGNECVLDVPHVPLVNATITGKLNLNVENTEANLLRLATTNCPAGVHTSTSHINFQAPLVELPNDLGFTFTSEASLLNNTGSSIGQLGSSLMMTDFTAIGSTFRKVKLKAASSKFYGCELRNCPIYQGDALFVMANTTVYITRPDAGFVADATYSYASQLQGVTISINPDILRPPYSQPLVSLGSHVEPTTSNITSDALWLSSNTAIHTLTLKRIISSSSTNTLEGPGVAGTGSSWTFHSIEASDQINLNFSTVDSLIYKITNPEKGIMVNGTANVPIDLPIKVQLGTFEDPSYSISTFQWYPIITVPETYTHQNPGQVTFSDDLVLNNPTFYSVETKVEQEPSQQKYKLYYRRVIVAASSCPASIPIHFTCVNGVLIATGSIDTTTITFPPDTQAVFIPGNLTTSNPITLSSTGTKLFVEGCISAPGIEIDLEGQKDPSKGLPSDSTLIASQSENCPQSVDTLSLTVKQSKKSCKEVKVKKDDERSSSQTLAVLFSIDNSKCNTKWIILGSVLGGVVLILLVLVLVFTFSKKARECARPFSARRNTKNTT